MASGSSTELQLCLYLSVEQLGGGRVKGWAPPSGRLLAEQDVIMACTRTVAAGWRVEGGKVGGEIIAQALTFK